MADFQKPIKPSVAEALYTKDNPDEPACWFCTGCRTAKPGKAEAEACPQCAKWTCIACGEEASAFQKYWMYARPNVARKVAKKHKSPQGFVKKLMLKNPR